MMQQQRRAPSLHQRWFTLLAIFCLCPSPALAQDRKPIYCGIDFEPQPPYLIGDKDDPASHVGFEIDMMNALAKEIGRPIIRKHADFATLYAGLNRGDFDFAMNGLEITAFNRKQARFTRPYYIYQLQLVARIDDDRFTTLEECKQQNLIVGTQENASAHRLLVDQKVPYKTYPDQEGPFKDLCNKRIDAVLFDVPIAIYYVVPDDAIEHRKKEFPGLKLVGQPFAEGFYGIAMRKDKESDALAKELDEGLGRVIASGELKRILTKWHLWSPDQYRLYTPLKTEEAASLDFGFFDIFWLLLQGAGVTVFITLTSMMLAVALGLPIATMRLYGPRPVQWLATAYVEFFRGIPVLLLLYFLYFGLPDIIGLKLDALTAAIIGFGMNYAAYEAEIYRNGIQSVPIGQWEAAASLGMAPALTFRRIIFPQSIRVIIPPMTNDLIALFKDTSVVSIIAVVELSKQYQMLTKTYGGYLEIGAVTAALYLIMSVPLGYLSRHLEKRWGVK